MSKRVLITGGAGFIGSHLADYLVSKNQAVLVLDDLSTGSMKNIEHLMKNPLFSFVEGSVLDRSLVAEIMEKVDGVYHLAASVGVKLIVEHLVESIHNNVRGTEVLLEEAAKKGKRVLLTSTSEVYGTGRSGDLKETDFLQMGPPFKTRWSYACSKALDEYMAFAYFHEHKLPVTVVRLFNTVGPRQSANYGMVIPTLVKQALADKPLTIFGDGLQSRCFCHVSDVVEALYSLMENEKAVGEVYNIGSSEQVTINQLADTIINLTGTASEKEYIPYDQVYHASFEDIDKRTPDTSKAKELIGFDPKYSVSEIVAEVIEDMETGKNQQVNT